MTKAGQQSNNRTQSFRDSSAIFMMGEELKRPLSTIKVLAESDKATQQITLEAKSALKTIDNILLYQRLTQHQQELFPEPVHIGSALASVANDMEAISLHKGCETEIHVQSGVSVVDVDRSVLHSAVESLWQATLGLTRRPSPLVWRVYRATNGVRLVVTNNSLELTDVVLSKKNFGASTQPYNGAHGPATDLVTAQGMFTLLGSNLSKTKIEGEQGLSATLTPSKQLALV